jgi:hypothetical protein
MTIATLSDEKLLERAYQTHEEFLRVMHPLYDFDKEPEKGKIEITPLLVVVAAAVKRGEGGELVIELPNRPGCKTGKEEELEEFDYLTIHESAHYLDLIREEYDDSQLVRIAEYVPRPLGDPFFQTYESHVEKEKSGIDSLRRGFGETLAELATLIFVEKTRGERTADKWSTRWVCESQYLVRRVWNNQLSMQEKEEFLKALAR